MKKGINKCLEELSKNFEKSINELKILFEKINENKETLKIKLQKIFSKIRNTLTDREDELLLDIDNKFNNLFINQDIYLKKMKN